MSKSRFLNIDFLRALSILGMIAIHTLSYNMHTSLQIFLWDWLHFVVIGFVFCSGYVNASSYSEKIINLQTLLGWYKKRLLRLLIPFYIYLIVHYSLWIIFPKYLSGLDLKKTIPYFLNSALLVSGDNLNWLVLLFLQITVIFPLLMYILNKKKALITYLTISLLITFSFGVWNFHPYYRLIMWIPWSLILVLGIYTYKLDQKISNLKIQLIRYSKVVFISAILYLIFYALWVHLDKSLILINNKYPPNLYYLFYGISVSFIILILGTLYFMKATILEKFITFISTNSYQLFFIHFIILDIILTTSSQSLIGHEVGLQFGIVVILSLFLVKISRMIKII